MRQEGHMTTYRLYCLDGSGRIDLADWFEAQSDEDAVAVARTMKANARRCELWKQNRLIAALDMAQLTADAA